MRYVTTRNCVDCQRQRRREERSGGRKVRDVNAELFRMNYLAVYAQEHFDAEGWSWQRPSRFDEGGF